MPRTVYQADGTQAEIFKALRAAGCSVSIIAGANGNTGVPDAVVGRATPDGLRTWLLEVKQLKGKLSPAQERWHAAWRGQVAVVRTVDEALAAVGLVRVDPKPEPKE